MYANETEARYLLYKIKNDMTTIIGIIFALLLLLILITISRQEYKNYKFRKAFKQAMKDHEAQRISMLGGQEPKW